MNTNNVSKSYLYTTPSSDTVKQNGNEGLWSIFYLEHLGDNGKYNIDNFHFIRLQFLYFAIIFTVKVIV